MSYIKLCRRIQTKIWHTEETKKVLKDDINKKTLVVTDSELITLSPTVLCNKVKNIRRNYKLESARLRHQKQPWLKHNCSISAPLPSSLILANPRNVLLLCVHIGCEAPGTRIRMLSVKISLRAVLQTYHWRKGWWPPGSFLEQQLNLHQQENHLGLK